MEQVGDKGARIRRGRKGLAVAAIVTASGILLIYEANNTLSAATPSQALVAYVGVFVAAAGILYGASALLVPE
jgi:hypothetical protein